MKVILLRVTLLLLLVLLLVTGLTVYLLNDERFVSRQLQNQLAEAQGWQLELDGGLALQWGKNTLVKVQGLRLLNPEWPEQKLMFSAGSMRLELAPLQLLRRRLVMGELQLSDCEMYYLENEEGISNWMLRPEGVSPEARDTGHPSFSWSLHQAMLSSCDITVLRAGHDRSLDIHLAQAELQLDKSGNLAAHISGSLDQQDLSLDGHVGPWSALWQGGPLQHEINLQAGDVHLLSTGNVESFWQGKGANLELRFSGPEFGVVTEWLALPEFSKGAFDVKLNVKDPEDQGLTQLSIAADLGNLEIQGQGEMDRWVAPEQGRMELEIQGPDLDALARTFGQEWLVARPFAIQLKADIANGQTQLDHLSLKTGTDRITVSGEMGPGPGLPGSALNIDLQSSDLKPWLEAAETEMLPVGKATLSLQLSQSTAGKITLAANGQLGNEAGQERPLELHASLQQQDGRFVLKQLDLKLAEDSLNLSGHLNLDQEMVGSQIGADLQLADLAGTSEWLGLTELPGLPFAAKGGMRLQGADHMILQGVELVLGQTQARLDADLQLGPGLTGSSVQWTLQGKELAELWPDLSQELESGPFSLDGDWRREAAGDVFNALRFQSENLTLAVTGSVSEWTEAGKFMLNVDANSPDTSRYIAWIDPFLDSTPMAVKFSITGSKTNFTAADILFSQGKNTLAGDLKFEMTERPRVSGEIHSKVLDLVPAELHWMEVQQKSKQSRVANDSLNKRLFSEQPINLFGDSALDLSLDIRVDRLLLSSNEFREVDLHLDLQPQSLHLNPFAFRGVKDGQYRGRLSGQKRGDQTELKFQATAEDLQLGHFGVSGLNSVALPPADIEVDLAGIGRNWRALAESLSGKVRWYSASGRISNSGLSMVFSDLLTQIFNTLNPLAKKSQYTELKCAVYAGDFLNGKLKLAPVVIQTDQITAFSEGEVDLATEQISLNFRTVARKGLGISAGSVVNPFFKIGGTLLNPALQLDVTRGAISGGAMVATAGLSVLFKSMSDRLLVSKHPCADARATIELQDSGPTEGIKG